MDPDPTYPSTLLPRPVRAPRPAGDPAPTASDGPPAKNPKKVRTSRKGQEVELLAIKLLEAEGYKVHRCVRTGVKRGPFYFSQSNDVFGCIDLVGKKKGERTRWIQVTAHSGIGQKKKEIHEVPWDPIFDSVEIWRWVGGRKRKHKVTGAALDAQYFQVYHFDDGFALHRDLRVPVQPGSPTLAKDPNNRDLWEVSA